jgi:hypothetical protein
LSEVDETIHVGDEILNSALADHLSVVDQVDKCLDRLEWEFRKENEAVSPVGLLEDGLEVRTDAENGTVDLGKNS